MGLAAIGIANTVNILRTIASVTAYVRRESEGYIFRFFCDVYSMYGAITYPGIRCGCGVSISANDIT